ncbi:MAG: phosphoglycerate dehydrogenase [Lawsonibacter sp.]|nr:phosphoglycerate dehydrogenase [Lawsonibacter sp.]
MKCLIIDVVSPAIAEELGKYMDVTTCEQLPPSKDELKAGIGDVDVLIMRVDPKIDKEVLDAAKNLKVIGVCSVGLNHVDTKYAEEKGVQVFNAPGLNGNAVAELTICKMLELSRHTIPAHRDVTEIFAKNEATSMSIAEVCKVSDYITIHMPLNDETRNLFNAQSIAEMKNDAVVLNMARGGIVNEKDMCEALKAGKIGGYATDVLENEVAGDGLTADAGFRSPLFDCDNFVVSPHIGAQTTDASRDIGAHIINKVKEALNLK